MGVRISISLVCCILLTAFIYAFGSIWQLLSIPFIVFCLWRGSKQQFMLNPYYLIIPMFVSYGLYTTKMGHKILTTLTLDGHSLIGLCFVALILGFCVIENISPAPVKKSRYNENFGVIMAIGLLPTVLALILVGNPMAMEGDALTEGKSKFSLPIIGQLSFFLQASIIVACKNNKSKEIVWSCVLSIVVAVITLTKSLMVITLLFIVVGFMKFRPKIQQSRVFKQIRKYAWIIFPIVLISGFIYNNSIRATASGQKVGYYLKKENPELLVNQGSLTQGIYLNYLYFCCNWGNLQYNLNKNHNEGNGANTFAQFGKKLGIDVKPAKKIQPAYLNTHTFITDFYLDFGYIGAVIASFALGCIIFYCYRKFGLSNDALLLSFYTLVAYATIMMFFSNHFIIGYLLNYFITFGGYYFLMHRFKFRA